ncbi:MAG TPA: TolC family protein [Myxococcales bacterium]
MARSFLAVILLSLAAAAQPQPPQSAQPPQPLQPPQSVQPLTLDQAVQIALQRNPDLQKQVLTQLSSEQDRVIARGAILPRLDFNASVSRTRVGPGDVVVNNGLTIPGQPLAFINQYNGSITLQQLIFDGGKWWNNIAASNLTSDANRALVDEQRLQIAYLVEQRFYELVRAQRQLAVFADAARRSRDQADFTQRLFDGGRATQADVYAARANRDNDEITRLGQERTVELARADLAVAVGVDPSEPLNVVEPQGMMAEPAQPPPARDAVDVALSKRPSLKAAALTVESNRKLSSAAAGAYWPQVSLFGQYSRGVTDVAQITSSPGSNSQLTGAVNLTWNLFEGLTTKANVEKADIQVAISQSDLESGRRNVASDVQKAVAQLSAARAQARVAQQGLGTAQEGLRLARTRQEVGVGTQLEVRDAELKLTQAQLSVVGSLVDGREAEAALHRAQGG